MVGGEVEAKLIGAHCGGAAETTSVPRLHHLNTHKTSSTSTKHAHRLQKGSRATFTIEIQNQIGPRN